MASIYENSHNDSNIIQLEGNWEKINPGNPISNGTNPVTSVADLVYECLSKQKPQDRLSSKASAAQDSEIERMLAGVINMARTFGLVEFDPLLREAFLEMGAKWPQVEPAIKELMELLGTINREDVAHQIEHGTHPATGTKARPSSEFVRSEGLTELQQDSNKVYKAISAMSGDLGQVGNLYGYAMTSFAFTAWHCVLPNANFKSGAKLQLQPLDPSFTFWNPGMAELVGASKKRLLDKTDMPAYLEHSIRLAKTPFFNVGVCGTSHVAWEGWYLSTSSDRGVLPLDRAKLVGSIENLGILNWLPLGVAINEQLRPYITYAMVLMSQPDWLYDPAAICACWSAYYNDAKRASVEAGKWTQNLSLDDWQYIVAQPVENVASAQCMLLIEAGVSVRTIYTLFACYRRFNDVVDLITDLWVGEINNRLTRDVRHLHASGATRMDVALACVKYHEETIRLRESIPAQEGVKDDCMRDLCKIVYPVWYVWICRYNLWHKFLLGWKSGVVVGKGLPTINWDFIDGAYALKLIERWGGARCLEIQSLPIKEKGDKDEGFDDEEKSFRIIYTALVMAIIGITSCDMTSCLDRCGKRIAEYMDVENGGESVSFASHMMGFNGQRKVFYHKAILNVIDSMEFSLCKYAAAGVGFYFDELSGQHFGSLAKHCARKRNEF